MKLDYLDMYLIYYPGEGNPYDAWRGLIENKEDGFCLHCGVSNFEIKHLEILYRKYGQYPEMNQIEFHPLLYSKQLQNLVDYCKDKNILLEGYCPLAQFKGELFNNK